ncbi:MAG TPA: DNA topoisomerase I [Candidatus Bathyarchaeia archaeon]|nr:DNA topoisomerase I [Candidatus Bathyarchaeia archaeon]
MYTLIICEKPDAASRVARAIDDDYSPRREQVEGVPVFKCNSGLHRIVVCSALGHLYTLDSKGRTPQRYYPVWDYDWRARHLTRKKDSRLSRWIRVISSLAAQADSYINACDYDIEGAVIGHTVLKYACNGADRLVKRMKFSTMTDTELRHAFKNLLVEPDFATVEAGLCRHELDWLYGINLTRLLTHSTTEQSRGYSTVSTGRVQGPTLKFIVDRENQINSFVPTPYWKIEAAVSIHGKGFSLEYGRDKIPSQNEATAIVNALKGSWLGVSKIEAFDLSSPAPYPFDLAALQAESFRIFHYTPSRTLAIAERLYLNALISYPRTSSQKLPAEVGYPEILRGMSYRPEYRALVSKLTRRNTLRPNEGPKGDAAHPAIYPTGEVLRTNLGRQEWNILDLIIRGFMATFAEPSLQKVSRIILENGGHRFHLTGSQLIVPGWREFYSQYVSIESRSIPVVKVGDIVDIQEIMDVKKRTEPPPRYNPSSLLKKMEDERIGTKATRSEIIDILYRRSYITDIRIHPTPLALELVSLLGKYCPLIVDSSFTSQLETDMEDIQGLRSSRRRVILRALGHLRSVMQDLMSKQPEIGETLSKVVMAQKMDALTFNYPCPTCASTLRIIKSRASGKRFVGCTGWKKGCKFSLPLPQYGVLSITKRNCDVCGFQMVEALPKSRRRLVSCPRCYMTKRSRESADTLPVLPLPS